jgi:hypothetical protein
VVRETTEIITTRLDENSFRVRFDLLTPRERQYLRSIAELGSGLRRMAKSRALWGVRSPHWVPCGPT